jgi:hypothetical protein
MLFVLNVNGTVLKPVTSIKKGKNTALVKLASESASQYRYQGEEQTGILLLLCFI